jgi:hypothetical protein
MGGRTNPLRDAFMMESTDDVHSSTGLVGSGEGVATRAIVLRAAS